MDPPDAFHRLHPNVRTAWILGDLIFTVMVSAGTIGVEIWNGGFFGLPPGVLGAGVFVGLSWLVVAWAGWQYKAASYACRAHDIVVCQGVLWKKRICIPRPRVQHVDVESGPIERKLGLCHLSIYTAGNATAAAKIEGLEPPQAEHLRADLIGETTEAEPRPPAEPAEGASESAGHA
jgi:uncharacterized protein